MKIREKPEEVVSDHQKERWVKWRRHYYMRGLIMRRHDRGARKRGAVPEGGSVF